MYGVPWRRRQEKKSSHFFHCTYFSQSFLRLLIQTTFSVSIHTLLDISVAPLCFPLWTMQGWMNTGRKITFLRPYLTSFVQICRSGITESCSFTINFLRSLHIILNNSYTTLHFRKTQRVQLLCIIAEKLFLILLIVDILMSVKCNLVVLIFFCFMTNAIGHLFICLLATCIIFFRELSIKSLLHFLMEWFGCCWVVEFAVYTRFNPLCIYIWYSNIFPTSEVVF